MQAEELCFFLHYDNIAMISYLRTGIALICLSPIGFHTGVNYKFALSLSARLSV